MEQKEWRKLIEAILKYDLKERVVTLHPVYVEMFGGKDPALLFQQICFWSDKGRRDDGVIYKTALDIERETTLTERVQLRAKKKLKALGVLDYWLEKVKGAPVCHYRINWQILRNRIMDSYQLAESSMYSESTGKEDSQKAFPSKQGNAPCSRTQDASQAKKRVYINPTTQRLIDAFIEKCLHQVGIRPIVAIRDHRLVTFALNTGGLTEKQILDLFDEWFALGKSDEDTIQITRALSKVQINTYKVRNDVRD